MALNLYIDTNIFLKFYHYTSDDLEELRKLSVLLGNKKVILFLPEQTVAEFKRNRETKIADALKTLKEQKTGNQFPQFCKGYPEYQAILDAAKEYNKKKSELLEKLMKDIQQKTLKADGIIKELMEKSNLITSSEQLFSIAKNRYDLGNPPGKNASYGDALNWEALLSAVPDAEELYFITDDGDYFSKVDKDRFNDFLKEEWTGKKKGGEIRFFKSLSTFFKDQFPDIHLADELEKDLLISKLENSGNFARSRSLLHKLSKYDDFSTKQVNDIVSASISNDQIFWIGEDKDINAILNSIVSGNEENIDPDSLASFNAYFNKKDPPPAVAG